MLVSIKSNGRFKTWHVDAADVAAATPLIDYERLKKADEAYLIGDGAPRKFNADTLASYEYLALGPQPDVWD